MKAWINSVDRALADRNACVLLTYSNAWMALEKGALADFSMDAASLAGQTGWFWVEKASQPMECAVQNKRLAMRALYGADTAALAMIIPLLDHGLGVRAVSSAVNDRRVSDERAWDLIERTWPLALSLDVAIERPCQDWRPLSALLTQCSITDATRIYQVFGGVFAEMDTRGQCFSTTWLSSSCSAGQGLELCADTLRLWMDSKKPFNYELRSTSQKALANGAADYLAKMSDIARGCSSLPYWRAWKSLAESGFGDWHTWIKSCRRGIDQLSDNQKRSVGFSMIRDGLDQFKSEGAVFEFDIFDEIIEVVLMLRKPWVGVANHASVAERHCCLLAEESSVEWAMEMGKANTGWDRFIKAMNRIDPKAAATLSREILAQGMFDGAEEKQQEQASQDRKSKRL